MTIRPPQLWILWSPQGVTALDAAFNELASGATIASLAGHVSGPCALLLHRRSVFVKTARLPNAKGADMDAIVRMQAGRLFPNAQGELEYGFQLTNDMNAEGRLALLVAAPVALLDQLFSECKEAGLNAQFATPVSIGAASLATEAGRTMCALVETGADGTSIDIVDGGVLAYSRVCAPGSDIAAEIERTFAAAGVTPGAVVAGKRDQVSAATLRVERTSAQAAAESVLLNSTLALDSPRRRGARELALVNSRMRLAILMALAAVGVGAVVWDGRDRAQAFAQKGRAEYMRDIRGWSSKRDAQASLTGKSNTLAIDVRRAFEPAQSPSDVLTLIGNSAPQGIWLTGITFERGKDLLLRGTATNNEAVTAYLDALTQNDRFRDVKLAFANQSLIESTNVVQFSMTAHVVGNLPTVKTKKERSGK